MLQKDNLWLPLLAGLVIGGLYGAIIEASICQKRLEEIHPSSQEIKQVGLRPAVSRVSGEGMFFKETSAAGHLFGFADFGSTDVNPPGGLFSVTEDEEGNCDAWFFKRLPADILGDSLHTSSDSRMGALPDGAEISPSVYLKLENDNIKAIVYTNSFTLSENWRSVGPIINQLSLGHVKPCPGLAGRKVRCRIQRGEGLSRTFVIPPDIALEDYNYMILPTELPFMPIAKNLRSSKEVADGLTNGEIQAYHVVNLSLVHQW